MGGGGMELIETASRNVNEAPACCNLPGTQSTAAQSTPSVGKQRPGPARKVPKKKKWTLCGRRSSSVSTAAARGGRGESRSAPELIANIQ